MKTRHITNTDQKIDELNSYIEEQFCSRDKILEEICENLGNNLNYNSQMN